MSAVTCSVLLAGSPEGVEAACAGVARRLLGEQPVREAPPASPGAPDDADVLWRRWGARSYGHIGLTPYQLPDPSSTFWPVPTRRLFNSDTVVPFGAAPRAASAALVRAYRQAGGWALTAYLLMTPAALLAALLLMGAATVSSSDPGRVRRRRPRVRSLGGTGGVAGGPPAPCRAGGGARDSGARRGQRRAAETGAWGGCNGVRISRATSFGMLQPEASESG